MCSRNANCRFWRASIIRNTSKMSTFMDQCRFYSTLFRILAQVLYTGKIIMVSHLTNVVWNNDDLLLTDLLWLFVRYLPKRVIYCNWTYDGKSSWGLIPQAWQARVASSVILLSAVNTSVVSAFCFLEGDVKGADFSVSKISGTKRWLTVWHCNSYQLK